MHKTSYNYEVGIQLPSDLPLINILLLSSSIRAFMKDHSMTDNYLFYESFGPFDDGSSITHLYSLVGIESKHDRISIAMKTTL